MVPEVTTSALLVAVVGISVLKHAGLKPSGVEEAEWIGPLLSSSMGM